MATTVRFHKSRVKHRNDHDLRAETFVAATVSGGNKNDDFSFFSQGCQMAKFDPFLSLDWARVEGGGAQSKERKGSNFAA